MTAGVEALPAVIALALFTWFGGAWVLNRLWLLVVNKGTDPSVKVVALAYGRNWKSLGSRLQGTKDG